MSLVSGFNLSVPHPTNKAGTKLSRNLAVPPLVTRGQPPPILHISPLSTRSPIRPWAASCSEGSTMEVEVKRVDIVNGYGEKLAGVLHDTGSEELVVLCHGFRSSKEYSTLLNIATALTRERFSVFLFDFAGNGESEGIFQYGNYRREADDLRSVILYFISQNRKVAAIAGHSKGGNIVLLYASVYHDVPTVVNMSGRFALEEGIESRLGAGFMDRIMKDGYIDVKERTGDVEFRVTKESLMDRLSTDMHGACLSIGKNCRVLTIHGSADEVIPVKDATEFAKLIPNHKLHVVEGANHGYSSHQNDLVSAVVEFIKAGNLSVE